ncbi:MAG TPA: hypothetical protein VGE93_07035, partial [Bryobacteraceae bacterium]
HVRGRFEVVAYKGPINPLYGHNRHSENARYVRPGTTGVAPTDENFPKRFRRDDEIYIYCTVT